jgi:antitoxin component YwqK of YwqJK toxin-antitoxin module
MIRLASLFVGILLTSITWGQINQTDAQGKKQGQWIKKYPNSSVIMYQGTFKNDKPIGTFTYNYQSNKVKAVIKHDEKTNRSEAFFYHENGKLMSQGIYRNMKKDSVWTTFNSDGRITMKETYKNDLLNGLKTVYYIPDDPEVRVEVVISEYNYLNGKPEGNFVEYYPNRQVRKTGQFKNNQRIGRWITYEVNGNKLIDENYYDGKLHGWFIGYDKNGKEGERKYFYYGDLVEGERLKKLLNDLKAKNISPYGGKIDAQKSGK